MGADGVRQLSFGRQVEAGVARKDAYIIHASYCAYEIMDGAEVISFCDDRDDPEKYLALQRAVGADAQDKALGMDAIHVELSDQSRSGYGLIESISRIGHKLIFCPTKDGEVVLGVQGGILIDASGCNVDLTRLIDALEKFCSESRVNFVQERARE